MNEFEINLYFNIKNRFIFSKLKINIIPLNFILYVETGIYFLNILFYFKRKA